MNTGYTNSKFKEEASSNNTVIIKKGANLANIPYWSGSLFLHFDHYFQSLGGMFFIRPSYDYKGKRFGDNTNLTRMGSFGLANILIGLEANNWNFSIYAKNLFDKTYENQAYYYTGLSKDVSTPGLPQRYGAKFSLFF